MFLQIAAQAFEAGDFLNIFLRFGVFEDHFLITIFFIKNTCNLRQTLNKSFKNKIEMVQHNAAIITTGAIKGTCCDKMY